MLNAPLVNARVPVVPASGGNVTVNVPVARVGVRLVMLSVPTLWFPLAQLRDVPERTTVIVAPFEPPME